MIFPIILNHGQSQSPTREKPPLSHPTGLAESQLSRRRASLGVGEPGKSRENRGKHGENPGKNGKHLG